MLTVGPQITRRALLGTLLASPVAAAGIEPARPNRLALLIGAAAPGDEPDAASNDCAAIRAALRRRGFASEEIVTLDGALLRAPTLATFQDLGKRLSGWKSGEFVLFYSGHGWIDPDEGTPLRPGLRLWGRAEERPKEEEIVYWDEAFSALDVPRGVRYLVLPDT